MEHSHLQGAVGRGDWVGRQARTIVKGRPGAALTRFLPIWQTPFLGT